MCDEGADADPGIRLESAPREVRALGKPKPVERVESDRRHMHVRGADQRRPGEAEAGEGALDDLLVDIGLEVIDLQLQSEVAAQHRRVEEEPRLTTEQEEVSNPTSLNWIPKTVVRSLSCGIAAPTNNPT